MKMSWFPGDDERKKDAGQDIDDGVGLLMLILR
jgi:hypothetical protein